MTSLAVTLHERVNPKGHMSLRAPLPLGFVYKPKSSINGICCSIHFSLLLLHSTRYETCLLFVESLNSPRTGHKKRHRPKASRFVDRPSRRGKELVELLCFSSIGHRVLASAVADVQSKLVQLSIFYQFLLPRLQGIHMSIVFNIDMVTH